MQVGVEAANSTAIAKPSVRTTNNSINQFEPCTLSEMAEVEEPMTTTTVDSGKRS